MSARIRLSAAGAAAFPFCTEIIPAVSLDGSRVYRAAIHAPGQDVAAAILNDEARRFGLDHREGESFAVRAGRALRQREDREDAQGLRRARR